MLKSEKTVQKKGEMYRKIRHDEEFPEEALHSEGRLDPEIRGEKNVRAPAVERAGIRLCEAFQRDGLAPNEVHTVRIG